MTWVLIVMTAARYGFNEAAIPGYVSETRCIEAGQVWIEKTAKLTRYSPKFVCIPGPHA